MLILKVEKTHFNDQRKVLVYMEQHENFSILSNPFDWLSLPIYLQAHKNNPLNYLISSLVGP